MHGVFFLTESILLQHIFYLRLKLSMLHGIWADEEASQETYAIL